MKDLKPKSLESFDFKNKNVFMRVDFNVPIKQGQIANSHRIESSFASIRFVLERGGRLLLASHLGRPKNKKDRKLSLKPVARFLSDNKGLEVLFVEEPDSPLPKELLKGLKSHQVILLENLRFHKGEEGQDPHFAKHLAQSIDIYINEGFSISHRDHTSITLVPELVPNKALGFQFQKELQELDTILSGNLKKPFCVLLGGSKLKDKIPLLESLIGSADEFVIGGLMAYTFLKAMDHDVGQTFVEQEYISQARAIIKSLKARNKSLILPIDFTGSLAPPQLSPPESSLLQKTALQDPQKAYDPSKARPADFAVSKARPEAAGDPYTEKVLFSRENFPSHAIGYDIGPKSRALFQQHIQKAGSLFWNGPMGYFEDPRYCEGTQAMAQAFRQNKQAYRFVGGGHSAVAFKGFEQELDHVSTGGGACLFYLQGKGLPALKSLL